MEKQIQTFMVTAQEKEGCSKHGFSGVYKLQVGLAVAHLLRCRSDEEVTHWPLHLIRQFGYTAQTFFLHAGTRCKTGEGKFIFYTLEGKKIAECMAFQIAQIQNQHTNQENKEGIKEVMHTEKMQGRSKTQAVKTFSHGGHSGPVKHRITEGGYTEPLNFLLQPATKSKQVTSVESSKSKITRPYFPSSLNKHEEDYYNCDVYSHLNRDGSPIPENVYGMASASASLQSSEECTDDTNSSTYEYVS